MMQLHSRPRQRFRDLTIRAFVGGVIALMISFAGCSQEPTEENSPVADLPLAGFATRDTTLPALHTTYFRRYSTMDGTVNLLGQNGSYTAYTVIQFDQSAFPVRDTIAVYSATLTLHALSWYGTPGAPFGFIVRRVNRAWSSYTLLWDSVQTDFYESIPRGEYDGSLIGDTAQITINLDTAMVREWFASSTTSTTTQFGIILIPTTTTQNAIRGFAEFLIADSTGYYPTLQVVAGSVTGSSLDTTTYNGGQDTFVGTDDHGTPPGTKLYVQGGVNYQSVLWFDLSSIPRGAILNKAILAMNIDYASSRISKFVTDTSLSAQMLGDSTTFTSMATENSSSFGRRATDSATTFAFDIRSAAQSWVRGPNYGVLIRVPTAREYSTPDLYVFDDLTAATPSKRPWLRIVYSIKSN
jgi:hypothetical protein